MIVGPRSDYCKYLCNALCEFGRELELIVYTNDSDNTKYAPKVRQVWKYGSWRFPFQILKNLAKDRPDVIHVHFEYNTFGLPEMTILLPLLLLLARIVTCNVLVTIHNVVPYKNETFIREVAPKSFKSQITLVKLVLVFIHVMISSLVSAVIVHAKWLKEYLVSHYKFEFSKIYVIPHGVDDRIQKVNQTQLEFWREKTEGKKIILCFGSITPRRGIEYLIEAFKVVVEKHRDYVLVIAGLSNPYYQDYAHSIKLLIERLGITKNVLMTGFINLESIHALHELADIVILSYTFSTAASGSLSFAIQHSKPVIASNIGTLREELRDTVDALLVPPKDTQSLVHAIESLIRNAVLRATLSMNLGSKIKERSWKMVADMTLEVYRRLASVHSHQRLAVS